MENFDLKIVTSACSIKAHRKKFVCVNVLFQFTPYPNEDHITEAYEQIKYQG